MPARTVRCFLDNQTDSPLFFDSDHHDHGEFTGGWSPPAVIAPGTTGEWRTESDGILTGTEGRVKYGTGVTTSAGSHMEFLDCYWDNPYIGTNEASMSAVEDFTNAPSKLLKVGWYIQSNGAPPPNAAKMAGGDVEAWVDGVLFPPYVLANWNTASYNDANAYYAVKVGAPPIFQGSFPGPPTGKKSSKLNTKAVPAEWVGHWSSPEVSVTIVQRGGKSMTAYITDRSGQTPLQFEQNFELGALNWVADHLVSDAIVKLSAGSSPLAGVFRASAAASLGALSRQPEESASSVFSKTALAAAETRALGVSPHYVQKVGTAVGSYISQTRGTVTLANGVFLSLYDTFTGGQKTGGFLHYSRQLLAGYLSYAADLTYQIDLH
jgi:hypothetical protein